MSGNDWIQKVDHVALAVWSADDACRLFIDALGGTFVGGGDNPRLGVRAVQIAFAPGTKVELLAPMSEDTFLFKYLKKQGPGFHHLTIYVEDVGAAEKALNDSGFGTVDTSLAQPSWHETFSRPSTTFGALIQFAKAADPWPVPIPNLDLADVLAGKVQVLDNVVTWKETGERIWPVS